MKLAELKVIEHETSPHGGAISYQQQLDWLRDAIQLKQAIGVEEHSIALFLHELDNHHHVIVLTDRLDQEEPIGYAVLVREGDRWTVKDVWLEAMWRGKSIITGLYYTLAADGYVLQSGDVLSRQAEQVWRALGARGRAMVIDVATGEIEPFSEKPIGDGSSTEHQVASKWRWVTAVKEHCTITLSGALQENFGRWLSGEKWSIDQAGYVAVTGYWKDGAP